MIQLIGGSGFVGTRLISLLGQKNCNNLDKNNSQKYPKITKIGDIRNIDSLIFDNNIKCVVLLAAEHKDDVEPKSLYYDVNVEGTQNVLNKMDEKGIKNLIFTSTVAIYGLDKKNPNENFPSDPIILMIFFSFLSGFLSLSRAFLILLRSKLTVFLNCFFLASRL